MRAVLPKGQVDHPIAACPAAGRAAVPVFSRYFYPGKYTAYIRKYGSLNLGRRFEQELARIHQSILMLKGVKNVKLHDLMTHEEKPVEKNLEDYLVENFGK